MSPVTSLERLVLNKLPLTEEIVRSALRQFVPGNPGAKVQLRPMLTEAQQQGDGLQILRVKLRML